MRISGKIQQDIRIAFQEVFPAGDELYLFGSRADDRAKGGDIDLLVVSTAGSDELVAHRSHFAALLTKALGDRKVDIVLYRNGSPLLPIHKAAIEQGVLLCAIPRSKAS
jgi:predicted nucleotidyltransferase